MTKNDTIHTPHLTILRGGKLTPQEFVKLPFSEKLLHLRAVPAGDKLTLILADPEGRRLARAMQPQELYWTIKETGESDALLLISYASPQQLGFILDMELWEKWDLSQQKALEWLGYLMEGDEARLREILPELDVELLLLILMDEVIVGGGIGELSSDDERTGEWDHSFDNMFVLRFKNPRNSELIGRFLDIIFRNDHHLYLILMEGVRNEIKSELTETAYKFRSDRLADLGFPELMDALSIYALVEPGQFFLSSGKELAPAMGEAGLPAIIAGDSLLKRVLAKRGTGDLYLELDYLLNNALVAEGVAFSDIEAMQLVFQRVYGYLNIALEFLSDGDKAKASTLIANEYLKRLFSLGYSIVYKLRNRAEKLATSKLNYAAGKAFNGIMAKRPRFYRGLDPDTIDGYREFKDMADVKTMEEFLDSLSGA